MRAAVFQSERFGRVAFVLFTLSQVCDGLLPVEIFTNRILQHADLVVESEVSWLHRAGSYFVSGSPRTRSPRMLR